VSSVRPGGKREGRMICLEGGQRGKNYHHGNVDHRFFHSGTLHR
jgi:hypothetical protein